MAANLADMTKDCGETWGTKVSNTNKRKRQNIYSDRNEPSYRCEILVKPNSKGPSGGAWVKPADLWRDAAAGWGAPDARRQFALPPISACVDERRNTQQQNNNKQLVYAYTRTKY